MSTGAKISGGFIALAFVAGLMSDPEPTRTSSSTSSSSRTTSAPAQLSDAEITDLAFVATIRSHIPSMSNAPSHEIVRLGRMACDAIDEAQPESSEELMFHAIMASESATDAEGMGFLLGASSAAYCPRWDWLFE